MSQLPGQLPMFWEDPPEEPANLGVKPPRPPINGRAGTPLDHKHVIEIWSRGRGDRKLHGLLDESQRVYQSGGELSSFIFWKKNMVTLSREAWSAILDKADWIEMIDHERNECWRILVKKAMKHAVIYDAGIGERIGVPVGFWDVIRGSGTYKRRGVM